MVRSFIMVCCLEMVWYDAGIRKLGNGDGMVTGGETKIKVSIPSHPIPIPFRYHPNTLPRKALDFFDLPIRSTFWMRLYGVALSS